jgi:hypothetical protein
MIMYNCKDSSLHICIVIWIGRIVIWTCRFSRILIFILQFSLSTCIKPHFLGVLVSFESFMIS